METEGSNTWVRASTDRRRSGKMWQQHRILCGVLVGQPIQCQRASCAFVRCVERRTGAGPIVGRTVGFLHILCVALSAAIRREVFALGQIQSSTVALVRQKNLKGALSPFKYSAIPQPNPFFNQPPQLLPLLPIIL